MTDRSVLARIAQVQVALIAGIALWWLLANWSSSPVRALAGAIAVALSYALLLAFQCAALWVVSRHDAAPRPSLAELLHAWWREVLLVPQVFFWRLPFRWRRYPDTTSASAEGLRGIVFVHGFICNRGLWAPWLKRLEAEGRPFIALNLEPVFGSIDAYAPRIDAAVRSLQLATGQPPMLVCHSMGGLAARAWLRQAPDASSVHRIITIGSPHRGTWLGRFSHSPNGDQMRWMSPWLAALERDESASQRPPFTCWYSHCDNIVFPTSSATLPGADNRLVRGPAHVELAFHPEVVEGSLALAE